MYDFALKVTGDLAVAKKSRQDLFMAKILAPCLELFGRLADILAELDQRILYLCRLKYGKPARTNASLNIFRMGEASLQWA